MTTSGKTLIGPVSSICETKMPLCKKKEVKVEVFIS